ncbi:MAG: DUF4350 domain-containing protein [Candidatus Bathyarchaeota archaeon]|nr:DUF4350 domain-containing protein [Candidatus Bathyarchaeota archaeon]
MKTSKLLLTLTLVIALSMATLILFFPPNGDFRVENPFWNGLSTFTSQVKPIPIDTFAALPTVSDRTTLFLVPYEPFSQTELTQLKEYVSNGGTLVVLDDYGFGNQVLSGVGLKMTFSGEQLLDPLFDYRNKGLPKITDFTQTALTNNVSSLIFNHASSLNDTTEATVAAYSSRFSFLDTNGDGVWDSNEPAGPVPVVAYAKLGQGYAVAVADPSFLINGMIEMEGNQQFVDNIISLQGSNLQVFVDQAHLPEVPLDAAKETLTSVYGLVSSPLGALSLIAVILVLSLKPIWRIGGKVGEKR